MIRRLREEQSLPAVEQPAFVVRLSPSTIPGELQEHLGGIGDPKGIGDLCEIETGTKLAGGDQLGGQQPHVARPSSAYLLPEFGQSRVGAGGHL